VVIGAGGRDVTRDAALGHVFGYTINQRPDLADHDGLEDTFH